MSSITLPFSAILTYCKHPLKEIIKQQQAALHAASAQPIQSSGGGPGKESGVCDNRNLLVSGAEVAHAAMMRLAQQRGKVSVFNYN